MLQDISLPFVTYPVILGEDVAGTVEAVGRTAAAKFEVGDRIIGMALGTISRRPAHAGFQERLILHHTMACKIPAALSFAEGAVFPLCITTAAFALFGKDYLGLPFPTTTSTSSGKSVLIWGGASAVGSNAIQLAKAAGFVVVATCSPRNFDYVKSLGAGAVFDYNSPPAVDDIVAELDKGVCAGIYHAAGASVAATCLVSHRSRQKLFVASSNPVGEGDAPEGVEAKMTFGTGGVEMFGEVSPATFGGFLPEALEMGVYQVAPRPQVVETRGLEGVQVALDVLKKGVSARKVVVVAE
ncbi:NAD(P)-binding protein [Mytilinidion resinicola]|uniref:NAD(P)-binding protein n=1 Tax=Mytilinidion resinicola TaxID=574789 RepID=A0A6A6YZ38_9PEZI|nr:NAD(P)-binding protein [Mytilinidion resinicola]KAF2813808.1 NAD(P)-binding protein [Mytilinidion resinicola]